MYDGTPFQLIMRVLSRPEVIITAIAFVLLTLLASYIANPPPKRRLPLFAPRVKKEKPAVDKAPQGDEEDEEELED